MALFQDYSNLFWSGVKQHFDTAKSEGAKYLIVYETYCEDIYNVETSISYVAINTGQEEKTLRDLANSGKNIIYVYELSLPFSEARKGIEILPDSAVAVYNDVSEQIQKNRELINLRQGTIVEKLRRLVFG